MYTLPQKRASHKEGGDLSMVCRRLGFCLLAAMLCLTRAYAQEDPLSKVHVEPPASTSAPAGEPKGAEAGPQSGPAALRIHPANEAVLRYLSPQIEWELLALTEHWRRELKIVFRKRSSDPR